MPGSTADSSWQRTLTFAGLWAGLGTAVVSLTTTYVPGASLFPALAVASGQWFVLRGRVSWAMRWAIAAAAGAVVVSASNVLLAPELFRALPRSQAPYVFAVLTRFIEAVPIVVALLSLYGARTLAWLVVMPAGSLLVRLLFLTFLRTLTSRNDLPLTVLISSACFGLIEAVALIWITRGDVLGAPAPVPPPAHARPARRAAVVDDELAALQRELEASVGEGSGDPSTNAAPVSPGLVAHPVPSWDSVLGPFAVLFVIAIVGGLVALSELEGPATTRLFVLALLGAPHLVAAMCLSIPRARGFGLGLGVGGAGAGALLGAPLGLFATPFLFLGAAMNGQPAIGPLLLLSLVPLHGLLAFASYRAMKRVVAPGNRGGLVVAGLVIVGLYAAIAPTVLASASARSNAAANAASARASQAFRVFDSLQLCLRKRTSEDPRPAWPASVDGLGPDGLDCLSAEALRPAGGEYDVRWLTPIASSSGEPFVACLVEHIADGRQRGHVIDESLVAYTGEWVMGTSDQACAEAYSSNPLRMIRSCLWTHAARDQSYPETLGELSPCAPSISGLASRGYLHTYAPAAADAEGRIAGFVLIEGVHRPSPGARRRRLDESGVIRMTREDRLPAAVDPVDAPSTATLAATAPVDVAAQERACAASGGETCLRLARALEERSRHWSDAPPPDAPLDVLTRDNDALTRADLARALDLYRRGCTDGRADACLGGADVLRLMEAALDDLTPARRELLARACALGAAAGCEPIVVREGLSRRLGGPERLRLFTQACQAGTRVACGTAAGMIEGGGGALAAEAASLFERGCRLGDAGSCLRASEFYRDGHGVAADAARATQFRLIACSSAPFPDGCPLAKPR